jgi:hypothetical protein
MIRDSLRQRDAERLEQMVEDATRLMEENGHKLGAWDEDTFSSRVAACVRCHVPVGADADPLLTRQIGDFKMESGINSAGIDQKCRGF